MNGVVRKTLATLCVLVLAGLSQVQAQQKPNVLIIRGDDIGYWNISAYNQGMMGLNVGPGGQSQMTGREAIEP